MVCSKKSFILLAAVCCLTGAARTDAAAETETPLPMQYLEIVNRCAYEVEVGVRQGFTRPWGAVPKKFVLDGDKSFEISRTRRFNKMRRLPEITFRRDGKEMLSETVSRSFFCQTYCEIHKVVACPENMREEDRMNDERRYQPL